MVFEHSKSLKSGRHANKEETCGYAIFPACGSINCIIDGNKYVVLGLSREHDFRNDPVGLREK
jgi:hypothetical protein